MYTYHTIQARAQTQTHTTNLLHTILSRTVRHTIFWLVIWFTLLSAIVQDQHHIIVLVFCWIFCLQNWFWFISHLDSIMLYLLSCFKLFYLLKTLIVIFRFHLTITEWSLKSLTSNRSVTTTIASLHRAPDNLVPAEPRGEQTPSCENAHQHQHPDSNIKGSPYIWLYKLPFSIIFHSL